MGYFSQIGDVALLDISEYVSNKHDPIPEHENDNKEEQMRELLNNLFQKGRPNRGCASLFCFKKHIFKAD